MATFASITEASKKVLKKIPYIHYLIWFKKSKVQALFNLGSEVNAMAPIFASKLRLKVRHTSIRAQKIDGFIFKMFKIVLASFWVEDKLDKAQFFSRNFLIG